MIRINLMPQKRRAQSTEGSQLWLLLVMLVVAAEIVGCFVVYSAKQDQLAEQQRKNRQVETQIEQSKAAVQDHDKIKERLAALRAREDAINELQNARTGPTAILLEIAKLLTPNQGPSISPDRLSQLRRENPLAIYNPGWDARRLWLKKLVEQNRTLRLEGSARDGEDVSELARRMTLSAYFEDVKLLPAKKTSDEKTNMELLNFQLEAKVKY